MKSTILKITIISILMTVAITVHAESAVQIWTCKLKDGKTPQDAEAVSSAWLKAAKGMKGGEKMKVFLEYPVAANVGDGAFTFVLVTPSFDEWGAFNGAYEGSAAAKADEDFGDVATCTSSYLWASVEVE